MSMVVWFTGKLLGAGQLLKQKEDQEVFEQQQRQRQQHPEQATPVYLEDYYGHRQSQEKATVPAAATQQSTMNSTDNTRSTAISATTSYAADNVDDLVMREQEKFGTTACYVDCDDYTEEGTAAAPIDDDDAVVLDSVGIGSNKSDNKAGVRMMKKTKATGTSIRNLKVCGNSKRSMAMRSAVASGSCNSIGVGVDDALVEGKEDGIDGDDGCDGCDEPPVEISHDVYNMFFLSKNGPAFFYAFYVWFLKMALYTFLVTDALEIGLEPATEKKVLAAQFLMLPVAVAMQEDLIATYYMIANVKYDPKIRMKHKNATKLKFNISIMMRGLDGVYSLLVNFIILIKATEVLSLFLNFAALQFLQHIDDIALKLAADGYLTDRLEEVAITVMETKLPRKHSKFFKALDSALFLLTLSFLIIAWGVVRFHFARQA